MPKSNVGRINKNLKTEGGKVREKQIQKQPKKRSFLFGVGELGR
jgi:hypothetical protein